jgi:hypothetical protein
MGHIPTNRSLGLTEREDNKCFDIYLSLSFNLSLTFLLFDGKALSDGCEGKYCIKSGGVWYARQIFTAFTLICDRGLGGGCGYFL